MGSFPENSGFLALNPPSPTRVPPSNTPKFPQIPQIPQPLAQGFLAFFSLFLKFFLLFFIFSPEFDPRRGTSSSASAAPALEHSQVSAGDRDPLELLQPQPRPGILGFVHPAPKGREFPKFPRIFESQSQAVPALGDPPGFGSLLIPRLGIREVSLARTPFFPFPPVFFLFFPFFPFPPFFPFSPFLSRVSPLGSGRDVLCIPGDFALGFFSSRGFGFEVPGSAGPGREFWVN